MHGDISKKQNSKLNSSFSQQSQLTANDTIEALLSERDQLKENNKDLNSQILELSGNLKNYLKFK